MISYGYDAHNRLTSYTDKDGNTTSYTYTPEGLRSSKTQNGQTTKFYWDRGYISTESRNSTVTAKNYIGISGVFAREANNITDYMLKNGHGDVVSLVQNGAVTRTYDYDAYGVQKNIDASDTNPFRYCGEYFDKESGSIYLRSRYYEPSVGRFTTEDPIRDGLNWYAYCGGNPVKYVDITGEFPVETIIDFVSIGWSYMDFVREPSVANFGYLAWDVVAALIPYAPGSYASKTIKAGTKIISKADDYVKTGVWTMNALDRGYEIERALGGMCNNFPVIDKFVAPMMDSSRKWLSSITSIKSIDTTAKTYQDSGKLYSKLKKYVDSLAKFDDKTYKGIEHIVMDDAERILELAIPPVELSSSQADALQRITEYANELGIILKTVIIE